MNSTFQIEHNRLFNELKEALKYDIAKITGKANGGRSILFVYPPIDDDAYIAKAHEELQGNYVFLDIRSLFTKFISEMGINTFKKNYNNFGSEVFSSDNFPEESFLHAIIQKLKSIYNDGNIPVLTHTGALYGMNFSNINIMEHPIVIGASVPLMVFYPATIDKDNINFLDKQIASKYRCIVIK